MDVASFQNPLPEYREVPFWSWNDDLDPTELRRQIGLIDAAGWGGFFMHPRPGLHTPYLGRHWLDCVRLCVEAARERGLHAWLYDEDKWPSGFAGGLSVAADPSHRLRYLVCKVDNRPALVVERIATFAAREVDGHLTDIRPDATPRMAADADRLIQFYPQAMPMTTAWFNDYAYASLLNPAAVRAFLDSTHEAYAREVGAEFGRAAPGIFTDEPCLLYVGHRVPWVLAIPWVDDFPAYFQAHTGYDLLPHLPALFFDVGDFHAPRYDYWRLVTQRFVESMTRQVYEWCEEHHLAYTGHLMAEDTLRSQIQWIGAAMPHYAYMHIPGIDKLSRAVNVNQGTILTLKQLDSVVCQLDKSRALAENYGCTGQDFAHFGRKWIGDWAYVLGITLNNLHLAAYSLRGERKRDFPPNLFYQQPWWPENRLVADYFARLSYALSQGQRVVDILLIHPMGSAWTLHRPDAGRAVDELNDSLTRLGMLLMNGHRDFHFGDEMLMEQGPAAPAQVVRGDDGPRLVVGKMAYRVVVVPPGVSLAANTVRLLHEFAAAGGTVFLLEPTPTLVDGRPGGRVTPETAMTVTLAELLDRLDSVLPFDVRIVNQPAIWAHHRRLADGRECYFLANTSVDSGCQARVQLRATGRLEAWRAESGQVQPLGSRHHAGITELDLDFPPAGSHLLVVEPGQTPLTSEPTVERSGGTLPLSGPWQLAVGGPNALTLDTVQVQVGDGAWGAARHILDAQAELAAAGVGTAFDLRFAFEVTAVPSTPIYLVVESPERFAIRVNGQPVARRDEGWWVDTAFCKVNISASLQRGRNDIELRGVFARDTELESLYVIGDFGVSARRLGRESEHTGQVFDRYAPDFAITPLPGQVTPIDNHDGLAVDLTAQGFPFLAGRAVLRQSCALDPQGRRVILDLGSPRAAVVHVDVNDQRVGSLAWPSYQIDVTAAVQPGDNRIEIELVGTLRNLLGPHHRAGGDPAFTGPSDFRDQRRWTDDYILVPFGLDQVMVRLIETNG